VGVKPQHKPTIPINKPIDPHTNPQRPIHVRILPMLPKNPLSLLEREVFSPNTSSLGSISISHVGCATTIAPQST